jgi:hypothetical protein
MEKGKSLKKILFALILLLDLQFLGLVSPQLYNSFNNDLNRIGQGILLICMFFLRDKNYQLNKNSQKDFWNTYLLFVIAAIFICGMVSMVRYNESFYDIFVMTNFMVLLLLIMQMKENFSQGHDYIKILYYIMAVDILLIILQSLAYNQLGIIFVKNLSSNTIGLRNGLLRYSNGAPFIPIVSLLVFGGCKEVKDNVPKLIRLFVAVGSIYVLIICVQTRSSIIAYMIALAVTLLIKREKFDKKCVIILVGIVAFVLIMQTPQMVYLYDSIFSDDRTFASEQISILVRQENIAYRLSFFKNNPLFGMGIIRGLGKLKRIALGPNMLYYSSDVGIFDTIASYGVFGIIMIAAIWWHWIKKLYMMFKNKQIGQNSWYIGIVFYYLLSSYTLGYFMPGRIACFAITCAILDYGEMVYAEER